jgi:hypothetical protein
VVLDHVVARFHPFLDGRGATTTMGVMKLCAASGNFLIWFCQGRDREKEPATWIHNHRLHFLDDHRLSSLYCCFFNRCLVFRFGPDEIFPEPNIGPGGADIAIRTVRR